MPTRCAQRVAIANPALLAERAPGRPAMLVAAHQNNFEWALQRVSLEFGAGLYGLYKPIRNPRVDAWFRSMRPRFGSRLIPAKSVLRVLARNRDCAVLGIIADQAPTTSRQKYWTTFLGQDTAFYMGPELLTRPLRAQVLYTRVRRVARGRYEVSFEPLHERGESLPQGEITERYARTLEAEIRDDPAGWWWSHKRWKLERDSGQGQGQGTGDSRRRQIHGPGAVRGCEGCCVRSRCRRTSYCPLSPIRYPLTSPRGASPAGSPSGSRTAR